MIRLRQRDTAEVVLQNHLASLAVYSATHDAAETLTMIEEMKSGLTDKICKILDPNYEGD